MELFQIIILGAIQGIFEWLPISSEGITAIIMSRFLGQGFVDAVKFSVWLHLGTLLAATIYFRKDIFGIIHNIPYYFEDTGNTEDYSGLTTFLVLATVISGVVGAPLFFLMEKFKFQYFMIFIGSLLILNGLLQRFVKKRNIINRVKIKDSIFAGVLQGFSILPGLSRSGLTTSVLLLRNYNAKTALRVSFLMSIPAVLAANIGLIVMNKIYFDLYSWIGVLVSFIFGLMAISLLVKIAGRFNFGSFCIFGGILSIIGGLI